MNKLKDRLLRLVSKEKSLGALATALIIAVVVVFNIVIFNVTSAFGLYMYSPEITDLTISGNTDSLFRGISDGKEVTVAFCMEEEDLKNHATGSYVWQTVRQFEERYDFVKVKYVNILTKRDETGELFPLANFITKDDNGNDIPIKSHSVIFYEGDGTNFRVVTDLYSSAGFADFFCLDSQGSAYAYIGEEIVASMISWVLHDEHPTVYVTEKHGETADISFGNMLTCAGYNVKTVNLRDDPGIGSDVALVIISNPVSDFYRMMDGVSGQSEIEKLEDYLERGGNIYVTIDPLARDLPILEQFLSSHGITISSIKGADGKKVRALVRDSANSVTTDGYAFIADFADSPASSRVKTILNSYLDTPVLISGIAGLELDSKLGAQPLLVSSKSSSLFAEGREVDNSGSYAIAALSEIKNDNGSVGHIVVVPSVYLTAADALVSEGYSNGDYLYALFDAYFDSTAAPIGCRAVTYGSPILEGFTMQRARIYTAIVTAIPVLIMALGSVIIIRRKNR